MTALDRLADSPDVFYYRDFAALRRAQLGSADRSALARLAACAERVVPAGLDKRFAAEAWALVAACAQVAGDDGRRERALSQARERDDDNPRIALVEAWALARRGWRRRGASRGGCGEAHDRGRGVRRLGAVVRRSRLGSRRGVDGDGCPGPRARPSAHGARPHRARAAARPGLSRRARRAGRDYRARAAACSAPSHRCVLRRAGIRYAPWRSSSDSSNRAANRLPRTSRKRHSASAKAAERAI